MRHSVEKFGAFYTVRDFFNNPDDAQDYRNKQPILHGAPRLQYDPGVRAITGDVAYVRLAKDEIFDPRGEFICDFTLNSVDNQSLALTYMQTGDVSGFHPVTQTIVAADEAEGLGRETIIELRAGIMAAEFLGFVPMHVFLVRPDLALADEVAVMGMDGEPLTVSVPRFEPGSFYRLDNPEFL